MVPLITILVVLVLMQSNISFYALRIFILYPAHQIPF